jgi:hypothetical protein
MGLEYGSQLLRSEFVLIVMVPPAVGVPSEFHQCATVVVVVTGVVVVDVFVDLLQEVSRTPAKSKKLKPKQINLFFNY